MNEERQRLVVSGRVQGVGFRWFVSEIADEYRISGWVRNLPDGTVEIEVQGDDRSIRAFTDEVREGPPHAHVAAIQIETLPLMDPPEKEFRIR